MKHITRITLVLIVLGNLIATSLYAQEDLVYQKPPNEILSLVDVEMAPSVRINDKADKMVLLYRNSYKSIAELSQKELRLGGLRINPAKNIGSRITYNTGIEIKSTKASNGIRVSGLPADPKLAYFTWSPKQNSMLFTHTSDLGVELWYLDIEKAQAKRLGKHILNANMGRPFTWFPDGTSILINAIPSDRQNLIETDNAIPSGPTISTSTGTKAQNRTYQDLLQNKNDEFNFEQLTRSTLFQVSLDGTSKKWAEANMYSDLSFSPNGDLVLITTIQKPFSYLVPYYRFPQTTNLHRSNGEFVQLINEVPLIEDLPKGFMSVRKGKRSISWRADRDATLYWAEALDEGDPAVEVDFRDAVYEQDAPFSAVPRLLLKTKYRYRGIAWSSETKAFAYDYWWNTRQTRFVMFNPSDPQKEVIVLSERNYQDRYSDPGNPVFEKNERNRNVIAIRNDKLTLLGEGHTPKGQFPFIDEFDLNDLSTKRIYQSAYTDKIEIISRAVDLDKKCFLVRIESPSEYPNTFIRDLSKSKNNLQQITFNKNPFKGIQDVHKEVIKYKRDDGVELSGTLYLPPGYDRDKKEKLPMLLWAYPTEYKDKASAGQTTANANSFTYPYYGSFVYWVTRGYAVLDNAAFPIIGEGDNEPNDNFRNQLVANAKAAIDAVDELGYIDRNRVACGGHSYGAFMVANLLSHCDLFAAGIARSGAYNRTLTPFGFQSEERSYWDAPQVYNTMSPFMHADKMKHPLLLIHGEADNNSGTYPMQSERYFNALKGHGATVRLVMLPSESHGYRARESILHILWEQDQWLEKYVKLKD